MSIALATAFIGGVAAAFFALAVVVYVRGRKAFEKAARDVFNAHEQRLRNVEAGLAQLQKPTPEGGEKKG